MSQLGLINIFRHQKKKKQISANREETRTSGFFRTRMSVKRQVQRSCERFPPIPIPIIIDPPPQFHSQPTNRRCINLKRMPIVMVMQPGTEPDDPKIHNTGTCQRRRLTQHVHLAA